jgi:cell division protein FtsW
MALGSGGFFGLGVGQSLQKYQYLPEATSDSIFAIVGEEVGFVGSTVLILLFMAVIWKGFQIAQKAPDLYGRLLATGITGWIGTQVFVNLASMVSLAPLTGIPLPLFSYGGTSLVVTLISIGILLNISKQKSLN